MQVIYYDDFGIFRSAVLDILIHDEIQNNLLIDLITKRRVENREDWLLATVGNGSGADLTAIYVKPFDLLLYETGNIRSDVAVNLLANELRRIGCAPPGLMAERSLALRFAEAFSPTGRFDRYMHITAMKLEAPVKHEKAPGACRTLDINDMYFAPYWERAFSEDCRTTVFSIQDITERLKTRIAKGTHFIWEDGNPVSQAVHGRDTPNGALINGVYTPPHYRGRGYASSVVAELSNSLLERGKGFCCLFADAGNPVSSGLYRKMGYYPICEMEDIRFTTPGPAGHPLPREGGYNPRPCGSPPSTGRGL